MLSIVAGPQATHSLLPPAAQPRSTGRPGRIPPTYSTDAEALAIVDGAIADSTTAAVARGVGTLRWHTPRDVVLSRGKSSSYDRIWDTVIVSKSRSKGDAIDLYSAAAHEHGHRIVDHYLGFPGLTYVGQSGALSEALAEANAAVVMAGSGDARLAARARKVIDPAGQKIDLGKGAHSVQMPAHMRDYLHTMRDMGGVHVNGGIIQAGFLRIVDTAGWDALGDLLMDTLQHGLKRTTRFGGFVALTRSGADRLAAEHPELPAAVRDAWTSVGLLQSEPAPPA